LPSRYWPWRAFPRERKHRSNKQPTPTTLPKAGGFISDKAAARRLLVGRVTGHKTASQMPDGGPAEYPQISRRCHVTTDRPANSDRGVLDPPYFGARHRRVGRRTEDETVAGGSGRPAHGPWASRPSSRGDCVEAGERWSRQRRSAARTLSSPSSAERAGFEHRCRPAACAVCNSSRWTACRVVRLPADGANRPTAAAGLRPGRPADAGVMKPRPRRMPKSGKERSQRR
jgi:hypothetical protein